jgi:hypothetical protein
MFLEFCGFLGYAQSCYAVVLRDFCGVTIQKTW